MTTISLGGVWEDLHCRLRAAVDAQSKAETLLKETIQEKVALSIRIESMEVEFKVALASLTMAETGNLKSQQILEMIRSERDELRVQCASINSQREWLEQKLKTLNQTLKDSEKCCLRLKNESADRYAQIEDLKLQSKASLRAISEKAGLVQSLESQLKEKLSTLEVVQHSLAAKDKMFIGVVKERDRLKDQLLMLSTTKHARSPLRNAQNRPTNSPYDRSNKLKEDVTISGNGPHPPPPSSSCPSTVSVGTQYDPLLESMESYRRRFRNCRRCLCGGGKADSDEEDEDINSNNPWNKKLPVSSKSFNSEDLTYLAIIRRLKEELKIAQSANLSTFKSPSSGVRRNTPIKSFR